MNDEVKDEGGHRSPFLLPTCFWRRVEDSNPYEPKLSSFQDWCQTVLAYSPNCAARTGAPGVEPRSGGFGVHHVASYTTLLKLEGHAGGRTRTSGATV